MLFNSLINFTATSAGVRPVTLTAHASAHTKASSWTQIIASTEFDTVGLYISLGHDAQGTHLNFFIDIAIGAAASEVIIIENIFHSVAAASLGFGTDGVFYINVPKGSRLSARCSCSTGASVVYLSVGFITAGRENPSVAGPVITYGANVGTSRGNSVTAGNATEGSWDEIAASTTFDHRYLMFMFGKDYADTANPSRQVAMDLAIGAAASEVLILSDLAFSACSSLDRPTISTIGPLPFIIPKGSRLAVRLMSSGTDPQIDLVTYGMG